MSPHEATSDPFTAYQNLPLTAPTMVVLGDTGIEKVSP